MVTKTKKKKIGKKLLKKISTKKNSEPAIQWTPALSVHENTIDSQHKKLFEQIQKMRENLKEDNPLPGIRECIHFLDKYIKEHFGYEESYMKKIGFSGLKEHQEIHQKFIKFYEEYKKELTMGLVKNLDAKSFIRIQNEKVKKFLGDWLTNHIRKEDHKYYEYAMKKGLIKKEKNLGKINVAEIAKEIKQEQIQKQRAPIAHLSEKELKAKTGGVKGYEFTGVTGFDDLLENGIPQGSSIIVAGGAGSGKTIFCLQTLINKCKEGKKCLYMTFEEREERLIQHMEDFGWEASKYIKNGQLKIIRMNPFDITRNVDAMLAKQKGELLIDIDPVIIPKEFKPNFISIDSLTAIASAFTGKEDSYRIYIEQLFRFLEKIGSTNFLITETEQIPKIFSQTGVEEFLADGVVVLYNLKHGNVRENALEILKLRGAGHQKKIVAYQITGEGITVYPEQEVFSEINE